MKKEGGLKKNNSKSWATSFFGTIPSPTPAKTKSKGANAQKGADDDSEGDTDEERTRRNLERQASAMSVDSNVVSAANAADEGRSSKLTNSDGTKIKFKRAKKLPMKVGVLYSKALNDTQISRFRVRYLFCFCIGV
jgi:hypothetical protein